MLYYAVIDTNVIVSAMMNPDSIPGNVLKHALGGRKIATNKGLFEKQRNNSASCVTYNSEFKNCYSCYNYFR